MHFYLDVLKKYAVFDGRARRKEYWMFWLVNFIIEMVIGLFIFFTVLGGRYDSGIFLNTLSYAYGLLIFLPSLGVTVRRLHDTGHSGWWLFVAFVPIVGGIILFIYLVIDGNMEENQYGPSPKYSLIEEEQQSSYP